MIKTNKTKEQAWQAEHIAKVKLSPFSRARPEGSLFNSNYTEV